MAQTGAWGKATQIRAATKSAEVFAPPFMGIAGCTEALADWRGSNFTG